MCLKDPPRDARSANRGGPWGRLRQRGSSDSAPARFGVPPLPPPDDCQCAFPIGKKGVRSKRRRPTGQERGRERRSECVGENRVGDSSKGGERQLHRGSSLRIVDQRRSLWSAACSSRFKKKKWTVDELTGWKTHDSLMDCQRAQWEVCLRDGERTLENKLMQWGKLPAMEMRC